MYSCIQYMHNLFHKRWTPCNYGQIKTILKKISMLYIYIYNILHLVEHKMNDNV